MSGPILRGQSDVSSVVPMPTDRVDDASTVNSVSGETLTWFYLNSTVWASATGQATSTLVWGKLAFDSLLNSNKATVGSYNNTSFSLGATTRFDTLVSIPEDSLSKMQFLSPVDQKAEALKFLTVDGYYAIDHRRGQVWGRSKATVADDSASYSYKATVSGSGGPAENINVNQWGGQALTAAAAPVDALSTGVIPGLTKNLNMGFNGTTWDRIKAGITTVTATLTGWLNTLPWAVYNASPTARTEGQGGPLQADTGGRLLTHTVSEDATNSVMKVQVQVTPTNISASTQIKSGAGQFMGICVNSAAAGATIKVWDSLTASGTILLNTITFTTAVNEGPKIIALPGIKFSTGLYVTIAVAALDCTVFSN